MSVPLGSFSLDRMVSAVEKVRSRLLRATSALEAAHVEYAVIGGNAVATWVTRVDEAAVRNTQDVDILLRRSDLDMATPPLESAAFLRRHISGSDFFLDGPGMKVRDAVHIIFAGEKVRPEDPHPAPDVTESVPADHFRVLALLALVRMKLTSFRLKDKVDLLDLLDVGLIDKGWVAQLPAELSARLQELIDNPDA